MRRSRRTWRSALVVLSGLTLTAYFGYHAKDGKHGLEARSRLIEQSSTLDAQIGSLEVVLAGLRRDIAVLRPEPPAIDIIEEVASEVLGYARPGDIVLRRPRSDLPN